MDIKKVPLTIGGKDRTLCYDTNALIDLGEALEVNLLTPEGWEALTGKWIPPTSFGDEKTWEPVVPTFRMVRAIVWAGLRHEDEKITERQVGAMMDPTNMGPIIDAYMEAWKTQDVTTPADESPKASSGETAATAS
jgi:hypothetical protein